MQMESSSGFLWLFVDTAAKSVVLLSAAWGLTVTLRQRSAAARALIWTLSLTACLALPLLSALLPAFRVLPGWMAPGPHTNPPVASVDVADVPSYTNASLSMSASAPEPPQDSPKLANGAKVQEIPPMPAATPETPETSAKLVRSSAAINWPPELLILVAWGIGSTLILLHLIMGWWSLRRLSRLSRALTDGPLAVALADAARQLNLHRPVELLTSSDRAIPMTWGIFTPTVLLPEDAQGWPRPRQRLTLLHELAHVQRHDVIIRLLSRVACALYWFNPLAWIASHALRKEQELAADDVVLSSQCEPSDYAQLLLDVTARFSPLPSVSTAAIGMARAGSLERRLRAVLDPHRRRTPLKPWHTLATMAAVAVVTSMLAIVRAQAPQAPAPTTRPATGMSYTGRVLADGKPVAGAEVLLTWHDADERERVVSTTTDNGRFTFTGVPVPLERPYAQLVTQVPGFGLTFQTALSDDQNLIVLQPATSVRVAFLDPDGKPVPNLRLRPMMLIGASPVSEGYRSIILPEELSKRLAQMTDETGTCTFKDMPSRHRMRIEFDDPRFARLWYEEDVPLGDGPVSPPGNIRLRRGFSISGVVTYGPTGLPVAGARVGAMPVISMVEGVGGASTNDRGEYRIQNVPAGEYDIRLFLTGGMERDWTAAALRGVRVGAVAELTGRNITLTKGSIVTGRMVRADTEQPIAGARIWANQGGLTTNGTTSLTKTGPDGTYRLCLTPGEQHLYMPSVPPDGYLRDQAKTFTIKDGETLTMDFKLPRKPGKPVTGRVLGLDGQPVVGAGITATEPNRDSPATGVSVTRTDGNGLFRFEAITPGTRLRATKSTLENPELVTVNGGEQDVTLRLSPPVRVSVTGVVTDMNNVPIKGARVGIITTGGQIGSGSSDADRETTDAQGRYTITGLRPDGTYSLIAAAEGFGQSQARLALKPGQALTEAEPLKLKPARLRIAGRVLTADGRPVENVEVNISSSGTSARSVKTDREGRFSFPAVEGANALVYLRGAMPVQPMRARAGDENIELTIPAPKEP